MMSQLLNRAKWIPRLSILSLLGLVSCGGGSAGGNHGTPPAITSLSPPSIVAGGGNFGLIVRGSGFVSFSVVNWNGSPLTTNFSNSSLIGAAVPPSDITNIGQASITVVNPGASPSNAVSYTIAAPPPPGAGVVQLITIGYDGQPGNGGSFSTPSLSATGRFVAFQSDSSNLVLGTNNGFTNIFVRDTCIGATGCTASTLLVSVAMGGAQENGNSRNPAISANGRYLVFDSSATNLVPNDTQTNGLADVFLRDTCIGVPIGCAPMTTRLSVTPIGVQSDGGSSFPTISPDGRFVAFGSGATNLVPNDTNGKVDAFVRDTCTGAPLGCVQTTYLVSLATDGSQGNDVSGEARISRGGRFVLFLSGATNLVPGGGNPSGLHVFLRDTCVGVPSGCSPRTVQADVATDGTLPNNSELNIPPALSQDGRFAVFPTFATNLVPNDANGFVDALLRDTCAGIASGCTPSTTGTSLVFDGSQPNTAGSSDVATNNNGRLIVFTSLATNLVPGGTFAPNDIFVRDTCFGISSGCSPNTVLISRNVNGSESNGISNQPAISADGHYVAFLSTATVFLSGSNGNQQVYLAASAF